MAELTKSKRADEKAHTDSDALNFKVVAQVEEVTVILSSVDRHVGKVVVKGNPSFFVRYLSQPQLFLSVVSQLRYAKVPMVVFIPS